jgi:hypothetical protein
MSVQITSSSEANDQVTLPATEPTTADRESNPTWYMRRGWKYGDMRLHILVSVVYLTVALFPLAQFLHGDYQVPLWPKMHPTLLMVWAAFVALAYPLWAWGEASVFERWVRQLPETQRKAERSYFSLHSSLAKNFWAAVLAIYTVAGLVGIALKKAST